MRESLAIARREIAAFFASLSSILLLAIFVTVVAFHFFWIESFFARNIADVRPMFDWVALVMILLVASLTMRSWSEERRNGTIELLLTSPVPTHRLVIGKFVAVMGILIVALSLTLPIPVMVAFTGELDPGPVASGYAGLLLLASTFSAIGLFVSSRTDNQIVSLIGTVTLCGLLHLVGSDGFTGFFGYRTAEWLGLLSSSVRLESMMRGVIAPGDLLYFAVVTLVFLLLNGLSLESLRQAGEPSAMHGARQMLTALLVVILLLTSLAVSTISLPRLDLTTNSRYTLSETTLSTLANLKQPLLLRGYFSERTHPMLNGLIPRMQDLLEEYRVAGNGRVRVELVDPLRSPELEQEAAEKYAIEPTAFQTADRYQASLVNSYFDLLVAYGDQFQTLNYSDLIELKTRGETDLEIRLRNPEYDLTAAIRKVLFAQRTHENLFDSIPGKIRFRAFISDDKRLPEKLVALKRDLESLLVTFEENAAGKLEITIEDPQQGEGAIMVEEIREKYGFRPMVMTLDSTDQFFFYMLMENDQRVVPVPLPDSLDVHGLQSALSAGLRNFAPGVLRKVALFLPPEPISIAGFRQKGYATWYQLEKRLRDSVMVEKTNLASGGVPQDADLLIIVAPEKLEKKQLFAIDQFLMQGGTVIIATSPWNVRLSSDAISAEKRLSGIEPWLAHHGITIDEALVMDTQLGYFPIPVQRQVGASTVEETRQLAYPYFIDLRQENLDTTTGIFAGINQLTMNWVSPLIVDSPGLNVTTLYSSSEESWLDREGGIQPDLEKWPASGFDSGDGRERKASELAILASGRFNSWFAGKPVDFDVTSGGSNDGKPVEVIEQSPDGTRLAVIGSGIFLADSVIDLQTQAMGTRYLNSLQFIQNLVDFVFEEPGLLALRGRGDYARMLDPLTRKEQQAREAAAIGAMFTGVVLLILLARLQRRRRTRYLQRQVEMNI